MWFSFSGNGTVNWRLVGVVVATNTIVVVVIITCWMQLFQNTFLETIDLRHHSRGMNASISPTASFYYNAIRINIAIDFGQILL